MRKRTPLTVDEFDRRLAPDVSIFEPDEVFIPVGIDWGNQTTITYPSRGQGAKYVVFDEWAHWSQEYPDDIEVALKPQGQTIILHQSASVDQRYLNEMRLGLPSPAHGILISTAS